MGDELEKGTEFEEEMERYLRWRERSMWRVNIKNGRRDQVPSIPYIPVSIQFFG